LTRKGEKAATDAMDFNAVRLEEVMHDLSPEDLEVLQNLLKRMREAFVHFSPHERRAGSAP
jgi:DNA-binding MarR family transcriptional regulator